MRPIIDNTLQTIFVKNDHYITQLSKTNAKLNVNDTSIEVITSAGFKNDDFVIVENLGNERAELTKINSISGNTLFVNTLSFNHDNKTNVSRATYNQINFYENNTLIGSIVLQPDYYSSLAYDVSKENYYDISFYNTENTKESPRGESIYGNYNLLCSVADLAKYEDVLPWLDRIIDKIDLASIEVRNKFIAQAQDIDSLTNRELLRLPTALLALYYLFTELIKIKDDAPSLKAEKYQTMYTAKLTEVSEVINKTDSNVRFFGQSTISR